MSYATRLTPGTSLTMRERDAFEQRVRQPRPIGGHAVFAGDRANRDEIRVRASVAHDADAVHRREDGEILPGLRIERRGFDLLAYDRVGFAHESPSALRVTSPMMRTAKPGPGNGCRSTMCRRQTEHASQLAHFVFEEQAQRLDQSQLHPLGQPADVVMRFDLVARLCSAASSTR